MWWVWWVRGPVMYRYRYVTAGVVVRLLVLVVLVVLVVWRLPELHIGS